MQAARQAGAATAHEQLCARREASFCGQQSPACLLPHHLPAAVAGAARHQSVPAWQMSRRSILLMPTYSNTRALRLLLPAASSRGHLQQLLPHADPPEAACATASAGCWLPPLLSAPSLGVGLEQVAQALLHLVHDLQEGRVPAAHSGAQRRRLDQCSWSANGLRAQGGGSTCGSATNRIQLPLQNATVCRAGSLQALTGTSQQPARPAGETSGSHVAQQRQRLRVQDAGLSVSGAGAHQEALGHLRQGGSRAGENAVRGPPETNQREGGGGGSGRRRRRQCVGGQGSACRRCQPTVQCTANSWQRARGASAQQGG